MFVIFGKKRINMSLVKEYKPIEKISPTSKTPYHFIELIFLDGVKEELHFFDKEKDRDEYLNHLDQNLLAFTP